MKILLLGSKGQLGREFQYQLSNNGINFSGFDIDDCDISNYLQIKSIVDRINPTHIINCTAYNLVDKAESEPNNAYAANSIAVNNLAVLSFEKNIKLIHFSSDYVFDGKKSHLYTETDDTNPLNIYGWSKLYGEQIVSETLDNYLIFRLSWVYGAGRQNFIYKMNEWAKSKDSLNIVTDEISVPSSTQMIAEYTLKAIEQDLAGLYHLVNSSFCSRFEWAEEIKKLYQLKVNLNTALLSDFNFPAVRPKFSAMSNLSITKELNSEIPDWKYSLKMFSMNSVFQK